LEAFYKLTQDYRCLQNVAGYPVSLAASGRICPISIRNAAFRIKATARQQLPFAAAWQWLFLPSFYQGFLHILIR